MKILIKNGLVVNYDGSKKANVLIENELIAKIFDPKENFDENLVDEIIDAKDKFVVPGLIDMHVHFRDPGLEYKDDIKSGSRSAVAGGVTTACCMANTKPVNDNAVITRDIIARANQIGLIDLLPIGAITKSLDGKGIVEIGDMVEAGACAFSDDGLPVTSSDVMRSALEYTKFHNSFVINHSQDCSLCCGGHMNEGKISAKIGIKGMPSEQEEIMIARDILLSKLTGGHIHLAHVSSAYALKMIKDAKNQGLNVTCEVTPHHFTFSEDELINYDTNFKMSPPLRTKNDIKAVKLALQDGTADIIVTDHAPHNTDEKFQEFDKAPFGILGLQTLIPLTLKLVEDKTISLEKFVELTSKNPAKILKLSDRGEISVGKIADIAIIDPKIKYIYDENLNQSKSNNSPLFGKELTGAAIYTIKKGKIVFKFPQVL